MNYIKVSPVEEYKTFRKYLAHDFDDTNYKLVNKNTIVYDENNEILAILIKNKITDHDYLLDIYNTFKKNLKPKSNRGASAGLIDRTKIEVPNSVRHLVKIEKNSWRCQYVNKNGVATKRNLCNPAKSRIIGYTDSQDIQKFTNGNEDFIIRSKKTEISRKNKNWTIVYDETSSFELKITPAGRDVNTYPFNGVTVGQSPPLVGNPSLDTGSFRVPVMANWAYVVVNGKAMYNSTLAVDFELHKSEIDTLVMKILELASIIMNKSGLVQIAAGKEASELAIQKIS